MVEMAAAVTGAATEEAVMAVEKEAAARVVVKVAADEMVEVVQTTHKMCIQVW